ncbi:hypothetical protein [Singulisphaera sp. PoT]|uniref:hypothetical protein n=1 Tax=Singulisphaera sp. PoT TaxID=3411797 RepID=UPI003BF4F928
MSLSQRLRAIALFIPVIGAFSLMGCGGSSTATTTAPAGHDGTAHGKVAAPPVNKGATKYAGPRR